MFLAVRAEVLKRSSDAAATADCVGPLFCLCDLNICLLGFFFCDVFTLRFAQMEAQLPPADGSTRGKHDGAAVGDTKHI